VLFRPCSAPAVACNSGAHQLRRPVGYPMPSLTEAACFKEKSIKNLFSSFHVKPTLIFKHLGGIIALYIQLAQPTIKQTTTYCALIN